MTVPRNNLQDHYARAFPADGSGPMRGFVYALPHQRSNSWAVRCIADRFPCASENPPPFSTAPSTAQITRCCAMMPTVCDAQANRWQRDCASGCCGYTGGAAGRVTSAFLCGIWNTHPDPRSPLSGSRPVFSACRQHSSFYIRLLRLPCKVGQPCICRCMICRCSCKCI